MRKMVIALVTVVAVALPANASAARLHGIVVGKQKERGVLVVASRGGAAWSVRTRSAARVGAAVTVSAKRLRDGTFAASRVHVTGRSSRARIRGVVVSSAAGTTFVSAGRSVLGVRSRSRSLMSVGQSGPEPGTVAEVGVTIGQGGSLTETSFTSLGTTKEIVIQANVTAITVPTLTAPGSVTLSVNGQLLVVPLPAGTVLPTSFVVGSTVTLTIRFRPAGPVGAPDDDDTDDDSDDSDDSDDTEDDTED